MLSHRLSQGSLHVVERLKFCHQIAIINAWPQFSVRGFADGSNKSQKSLPPRSELNNWYERNHGKPILNESAFEFEDHFHNGKIWWTARFTCPVTKKIYVAEPLPEVENDMWNQFLWSRGSLREPIEVDKKFYFQRLKTAMHAAAAERLRAIEAEGDAESLAEEGVIDTALTLASVDSAASSSSASQPPSEQVELSVDNVIIPNISQISLTSPKHVLDNYYTKMQSSPVGVDDMDTTFHRGKGSHMTSWWSSSFGCPLSGLKYASGSLRDEDTYGEVRYLEGQPHYSRAKSSQQAASARALDHIVFQATGVLEPRLCHEDPSTHDSMFVHPEIDSRRLTKSSKIEDCIGVTVFEELETVSAEVEDDPELTLQAVSPAGTNTLGRLMDAWSGTVADKVLDNSASTLESILPLTRSSRQQKRVLVSDAMSWLKSIQPRRRSIRSGYVTFHNPLQVSTLDSCNSILIVLGKANNGYHVQDVADQVFDLLWSGPKPNVDSYNAYLQCLGGEPEEVARKAQDIFGDMVAGRKVAGSKIPAPNVDVFNTVLRLWARTGDAQKCQELLDLLKATGLEANSKTYLNLLSSLAYGTFDQERASVWIGAMKNDGLFCEEAYEAPLRWAEKKIGSHVIPWDDYEEIYKEGFLEEPISNTLVEAEAVEAWIRNVEQLEHFDVSLGCYEALIQAWLRTGTRNGFQRAAFVAERLLDAEGKSVTPRLQTFLPILGSCAHCGEKDTFQSWKRSVRAFMRDTYPEFPADSRAFAMQVLTFRRYLEVFANADPESLPSAQETTWKALEVLKHTCSMFNSPKARSKAFVQFGQFHDTLSCCKNLSLRLAAAGNKGDAQAVAKLIVDVVSVFDTTVKKVRDAIHEMDEEEEAALEMDQGDLDVEKDAPVSNLELQLQHLLDASTSVYHHALSCLDEIDQACADNREKVIFQPLQTKHLPEVENMLRNAVRYRQVLSTYAYTAAAHQISFADGFTYRRDPPRASYLDLCAKIMEPFLRPNATPVRSDEVRIVMLMLDSIFDIKKGKGDMIQLSSICLDMVAVFQSIKVAEEKKTVLLHFLKLLSGKAEKSIGTLDINSIVRAAKGHLVDMDELRQSAPSSRETARRSRSLRGRKKRSSSSSA